MNPSIPTNLIFSDPPVEHIEEVGNLYLRSILLRNSGCVVKQHIHDREHLTLVGNGRARGWADGKWIGDKKPGEGFWILAGQEHLFQALESDTRLVCVHDIVSAQSVKDKGI